MGATLPSEIDNPVSFGVGPNLSWLGLSYRTVRTNLARIYPPKTQNVKKITWNNFFFCPWVCSTRQTGGRTGT